jgi:hypothetical protein
MHVNNLDKNVLNAALWLIHDAWLLPTLGEDGHDEWVLRVVALAEASKTSESKREILMHWGQPHPCDKWDVR